jgi:CRP-like cAMP-binding protein
MTAPDEWIHKGDGNREGVFCDSGGSESGAGKMRDERPMEVQEERILYYDDGEVIFEEDSIGKEMYVIISGKVEISQLACGGRETIIIELTKGDFFGEMAAFTDVPRSATARAVGRTMLMPFSTEEVLQRIQTNPEFVVNMLQTVIRRLGTTTSRLRTLIVRMYTAGIGGISPERRPLNFAEILTEMDYLTESHLDASISQTEKI